MSSQTKKSLERLTPGRPGGVAPPLSSGAVAAVCPVRLLPLQRVCDLVGFKRAAVLDKVAKGEFPSPVKFGQSRRSAVRWVEAEVFAFIWSKVSERNDQQRQSCWPPLTAVSGAVSDDKRGAE